DFDFPRSTSQRRAFRASRSLAPGFSEHDQSDASWRHSVGAGQFGERVGPTSVQAPNFADLRFREAPCAVSGAVDMPAFGDRVALVVQDGAQEQVLGANARGIVAVVADECPWRDNSVRLRPGPAVGALPAPMVVDSVTV